MPASTLSSSSSSSSSRASRSTWSQALARSFATDASWTTLLLRVALAVTILPHGIQKTLGWWGGYGFSQTLAAFTQMMGIPAPLALAAILAESVGALFLLTGLFTRLSAVAIGITMVVAAVMVHLQHGFFLPQGIEYFIPVVAISAVLAVVGGGKWALDTAARRALER